MHKKVTLLTYPVVIFDCERYIVNLVSYQNLKVFLPVRKRAVSYDIGSGPEMEEQY